MMVFWLAAAALGLLALGFLLLPLWRQSRSSGRWSAPGLFAAAVLLPLSLVLYLEVTTWSVDEAPQAPPAVQEALPSVDEMVVQLAARLEQEPEDAAGWQLLGQSYFSMGRYPDARQAFREAWKRTPAPGNDLKVALGEAEALSDRETLQSGAGALFEEVLAAEPTNLKALWYGGLAALGREEPALARERWSMLLTLDPPPAMARILQEQLAVLGGSEAAPGGPEVGASETGSALQLRVGLAEGLATADFGPQAALFVFARVPEGGPPLAVIRRPASTVPGEFSLSDADTMTPGVSLADFKALTLVARLSRNGQPTQQSGDLYGEIQYRPGSDPGVLDLSIDQVVP